LILLVIDKDLFSGSLSVLECYFLVLSLSAMS